MQEALVLIAYLIMTSLAAERFSEIARCVFIERFQINGVIYQVVSGIFGAAIALTSPPTVPVIEVNHYLLAVVVGLAVSAGSGFWNSMLVLASEYAKQYTTTKPVEVPKTDTHVSV